MSTVSRWLFTCLLVSALGSGCATSTRTVTTEAYVPATGTAYHTEPLPAYQVTTEHEVEEESGGILSGTVNVVGDVIALPFRAVGALAQAVF